MLTIKDYSARFDECQQKRKSYFPVDNFGLICYDNTRQLICFTLKNPLSGKGSNRLCTLVDKPVDKN